MRREEICQLKATDFDEHGGIWFVRVQATEGRSLKTPAAERDIPIHDELVRIGLRDFVAHRYPGWIFPELRRRSEEHTSELQSLMRISYAVFCLKKKTNKKQKSSDTYRR